MAVISCTLICVLIFVVKSVCGLDNLFDHGRSKRFTGIPFLLFPITAPTRHQLIFGIGIPEGGLTYESLTNGWVLKYEYFLPYNATQLYIRTPYNVNARSTRDVKTRFENYEEEAVEVDAGYTNDNEEDMYKQVNTKFDDLVESRKREQKHLSQYRWALYKAWEAATDRKGLVGRSCVLRSICETAMIPFHHQNGLLAELFHTILTPSSSVDELSAHSDNEYFHAEVLGKSGARCEAIFTECKKSLMDMFSTVLDINDLVFSEIKLK